MDFYVPNEEAMKEGKETICFSELTYSSTGCNDLFENLAVDKLMYEALHGVIPPEVLATPGFVEHVVNNDPSFPVIGARRK